MMTKVADGVIHTDSGDELLLINVKDDSTHILKLSGLYKPLFLLIVSGEFDAFYASEFLSPVQRQSCDKFIGELQKNKAISATKTSQSAGSKKSHDKAFIKKIFSAKKGEATLVSLDEAIKQNTTVEFTEPGQLVAFAHFY